MHKFSKYNLLINEDFRHATPNENVFRALGYQNFSFDKKKVLDIGFGDGIDLLECHKRGSKELHGIHISQSQINKFKKIQKSKKFKFHKCDLNSNFPSFKVKFDLIIAHDLIYYLSKQRILKLFKEIKKILNNNGLIIFQYIQAEYTEVKKNLFGYKLDSKYKKLNSYHNKSNPIEFLKDKDIKKIINNNDFRVIESFFTLKNFNIQSNKYIVVNRYFILGL